MKGLKAQREERPFAERWEKVFEKHFASIEPDAGLKLMNLEIMTLAEMQSQCLTDWAAHTPPGSITLTSYLV